MSTPADQSVPSQPPGPRRVDDRSPKLAAAPGELLDEQLVNMGVDEAGAVWLLADRASHDVLVDRLLRIVY